MAESMKGLKRTCRCGELGIQNAGQTVTVMGWVAKQRNKGGIIFVDLRDRAGLLQVIFEEADCGADNFAKAERLRSEFVVAVTGTVEKRSGAVNENLATGEIEVRAKEVRILSEALTPPFPIESNTKTKEEIRLKYRYLDLRRPDQQEKIILRSKICAAFRRFLTEEGFLEIETPILCKSTPEGARDYLVPSRVHPGSFYALPQSPQLFKQLLMCSGYDRYFQIAKCFRDEDLRADRQPEFTQVDMELSFVDVDDVIDVNERLLQYVCREAIGLEISLPLPRMKWIDAMNRFGSDKPDTRFGMELVDVSDVVAGCGFGVFTGALENGGSVRGINAKGQAGMPRKKIDALVDFAKGYGAKGLAYLAIQEDGSYKSSFAKFMTQEQLGALAGAMDGQPGDLLLFAADRTNIVWSVLGALRLELGGQMGLIDHDRFDFFVGGGIPPVRMERRGKPLYGHAPSFHHAHGRGPSHAGDGSREGAREGLRYRFKRRGAGRRQRPYFPGRRAGADVCGSGLHERARSGTVRLFDGRFQIRRAASCGAGLRPGSPVHAADEGGEHPRGHRFPQSQGCVLPDDRCAGIRGRLPASGAGHRPGESGRSFPELSVTVADLLK